MDALSKTQGKRKITDSKDFAEDSIPISVRVRVSVLESIDDWRRSHLIIPSRSKFLHQAIEEKLMKDSRKKR